MSQTNLPRLLKLKEIQAIVGLSTRTLRGHFADPVCPLRWTHHLSTHPTKGWRVSEDVVREYIDWWGSQAPADGEVARG